MNPWGKFRKYNLFYLWGYVVLSRLWGSCACCRYTNSFTLIRQIANSRCRKLFEDDDSWPTGASSRWRYNRRMNITLTQLEDAINYWRIRRPVTGERCELSPEVDALAKVYAMMIFEQAQVISKQALDVGVVRLLEEWRQQRNKMPR